MTTNKETKFESILKSMNATDKETVSNCLNQLEQLFKEYTIENGGKWLDVLYEDTTLRNIYICSAIAANVHLYEEIKKNNQ